MKPPNFSDEKLLSVHQQIHILPLFALIYLCSHHQSKSIPSLYMFVSAQTEYNYPNIFPHYKSAQ